MVETITREELKEKTEPGAGFVLVDTLGSEHYRDSHLPGTLNLDLENTYRCIEVRGEVAHVDEDPNLGFISSTAKKYLGVDEYPYHQLGDERVVIFVRPERTTRMGG